MTAPDRAALGERAARALQSALGEPLAKVLERVTDLLVAVQEETGKEYDDELVADLTAVDELIAKGKGEWPNQGYVRDEIWNSWTGERYALRSLRSKFERIRARGTESKTGGR